MQKQLNSYPEPCLCMSGSEENGWFEVRDSRCIQKELDDFGRAMRMLPKIISNLNIT